MVQLARKCEMDHELAMSIANNKRLKYEFKAREAEASRSSRLEELWLQVELARSTASHSLSAPIPIPSAILNSAPTSDFASHFPYHGSASGSSPSLTNSYTSGMSSNENAYSTYEDLNGGLDDFYH